MHWVRRGSRAAGAVGVAAALVLAYAVATWHLFGAAPPPAGPLAVWESPRWLEGGGWDQAGLASRLVDAGATDLMLHAGSPGPAGDVRERVRRRAEPVLAGIARAAPGVRVQAWLEVEPTDVGEGEPADRGRVATFADALLSLGFDGVHLEAGDVSEDALLGLLDEVRSVVDDHEAVLSVVVPELEPLPAVAAASAPLPGEAPFRTKRTYRRTAARVDQIVVRPVAPTLPTVWLDGGLTRRVVMRAAEALGAGRASLLVGLPSPEVDGAEDPGRAGALRGRVHAIRQGLTRADGGPRRIGLAVPAALLEDPSQRRVLESTWLAPRRSAVAAEG